MKKLTKIFTITIIAIVALTIGALAGSTFHLARMSSDYGINSYVLTDSTTGVEYIVVEGTTGITITPQIKR